MNTPVPLREDERAILERLGDFDIKRLIGENGQLSLEMIQEADTRLDLLWVLSGVRIDKIAERNPLAEISRTVASLTIEIPNPKFDNHGVALEGGQAKHIKKTENLEDMLPSELLYLAMITLLVRGIEVEQRTGPILEELFKDPSYDPTLRQALQSYFSQLVSGENPKTIEEITGRLVEMGSAQNDVHDEKVIVAIPVAGHQEYDNIFRTLEQFTTQTLPDSQFEIVLHVNVSAHETVAKEGIDEGELAKCFSKTLQEIERFKQEHPTIALRYFTTTYRGSKQTIGRIRADLWEAIGWDLAAREATTDVLILSADADIMHLNSKYLESIVKTAASSQADMIAAGLKWQTIDDLPYDAYANKVLRYQTFLDRLRNRYSDVHTADANTAIRASSYFACGGYDKQAEIGEMRDIRIRLETLRSKRSEEEGYFATNELVREVVVLAKEAELKTHSRRLILAMALGYSPYNAWDQDVIEFGTHDELRTTATQGKKAEEQASIKWQEWIEELTPHYMEGVPLHKRQRLIDTARRIIGLTNN